MENPPHDLLVLPIKFKHTNKPLSYLKGEKKSISKFRIWTHRKNAERLIKLIQKLILCKNVGWERMKSKNKKRNGLPPAGLADLDPWVWEQTKEQAKGGLKDNNTIQKVSMQTQHVFVHKHISKIAIFLVPVPPSLLLYSCVFYICQTT